MRCITHKGLEQPKVEDGERFLIEEFKSLWDYYKRTQDERHKSLDYFFKSVALPASLVGALTAIKFDWSSWLSSPAGHRLAGAILSVIFLIGLSAFTAFVKESINAKSYELALHAIRNHFEKRYSGISDALILRKLRSRPHSPWGPISRWQSLIFIFPNAAIGAAIVDLLTETMTLWISVIAFVSASAIQLLWENYLRNRGIHGLNSPPI